MHIYIHTHIYDLCVCINEDSDGHIYTYIYIHVDMKSLYINTYIYRERDIHIYVYMLSFRNGETHRQRDRERERDIDRDTYTWYADLGSMPRLVELDYAGRDTWQVEPEVATTCGITLWYIPPKLGSTAVKCRLPWDTHRDSPIQTSYDSLPKRTSSILKGSPCNDAPRPDSNPSHVCGRGQAQSQLEQTSQARAFWPSKLLHGCQPEKLLKRQAHVCVKHVLH